MSVISNKNVNLDSSDHRKGYTLKQTILNEPWPTGHDGASGPCSHMASFLHDRALVGTVDCVYIQWFLEIFGPFSFDNDTMMPMSDAVSSEGPKTRASQQMSSAFSLKHRAFSGFSESFDYVTVDDEISKAFAI